VLLLTASTGPIAAQENYPDRAIKIVVPLPPGPFADALPRLIANKLSARWRQPIIVENKAGFASNLGAAFVARANPDGYTLLATPPGPLVVSQHLYPKLDFDPTQFVPVSVMAELPYTLVVNPKVLSVSNLQQLIALAKASPGKLTFASAGIGSPPHLTAEMLMSAAAIRMSHVPYKGLAPAMTDLLAGNVDLMFDNLANTLPQIKSGRLRAIAVSDKKRIPELPDVPAIAEVYPGFYSAGWYAIVAPPKTNAAIAKKLSAAIADTLRLPDVADRLMLCSAAGGKFSGANSCLFQGRVRALARGDQSRTHRGAIMLQLSLLPTGHVELRRSVGPGNIWRNGQAAGKVALGATGSRSQCLTAESRFAFAQAAMARGSHMPWPAPDRRWYGRCAGFITSSWIGTARSGALGWNCSAAGTRWRATIAEAAASRIAKGLNFHSMHLLTTSKPLLTLRGCSNSAYLDWATAPPARLRTRSNIPNA
jgi:tripartite-type tricarboxylate transporter receptor subunit TctC